MISKRQQRLNERTKKNETLSLKESQESAQKIDQIKTALSDCKISKKRNILAESNSIQTKISLHDSEETESQHKRLKLTATPTKRISQTPTAHRTPTSIYQDAKALFRRCSTPKKLVGRNTERVSIIQFLENHLLAHKPGSLYISGCPGTGKTALVNEILTVMASQFHLKPFPIKTIFINCMNISDPKQIFTKIVTELSIDGIETPLETLYNYLITPEENSSMILLVLDEIDHLIARDQDTLYRLFEWAKTTASRLNLIGIANALDLTSRFLPRLATKNYEPQYISFAPYKVPEITAIIKDRLMALNNEDDTTLNYPSTPTHNRHRNSGIVGIPESLQINATTLTDHENIDPKTEQWDVPFTPSRKNRVKNKLTSASSYLEDSINEMKQDAESEVAKALAKKDHNGNQVFYLIFIVPANSNLHFTNEQQYPTSERIAKVKKLIFLMKVPIMQPMAIELAARKLASTGDLRKALDVCRQAIHMVELEVKAKGDQLNNEDSIDLPKVTVKHILSAAANMLGSPNVRKIVELQMQVKLVLCTILLMKQKNMKDKTTLNVSNWYRKLSNLATHIGHVQPSEFTDILSQLESNGLISITMKNKVSVVNLICSSEDVLTAIADVRVLQEVLEKGAKFIDSNKP
ncbi:P-loop containing nucleoside triphosphate hydrolase protein [Globomyces pollinis-pini]|nr:P-loop containing nucleoside triphosphate hydrolase protein [Globomyces pollinis-pini]